MLKKLLIGLIVVLGTLFLFLVLYTPPISENHGEIQTRLYLGEGENQPLVVGFGGGEGGNAWDSDYWKDIRNEFLNQGYSFLAIGYFGIENIPAELDRISLNAIHDSIMQIALHPKINQQKIALIGGSKGAELALNLASRYPDYGAIIGIVPSHVSFPANNMSASTSSWTFNGEEIPYVPMPWAAVPAALKHDLHSAFSIMLENEEAVEKAKIAVENIQGSILLVSATEDEMWPSTEMSEDIIQTLKKENFGYYYEHIPVQGGHTEPRKHFNRIFDFLNKHFKESL
ncbi:alpha/beta hydrolase [Marivirga sp. S37H4]|uniref:Alpha/beta hydrolase n=1 Tax=Marivirga aurantiaca TaxID=2802615 RepID=A0A934X1P3_9BACT|nr:acyl-CoA thioester hydrolase/BAAT C-terminal domain-containing protein [Marivirga aurantiaca]MBK6267363.1 alpha/beta hydrolase [Marivirga aurantiaca]